MYNQNGRDSIEIFVSIYATTTDGNVLLARNDPEEISDVRGQVVLPGIGAYKHTEIHSRALWYLEEVFNLPIELVKIEPEFMALEMRGIHKRVKVDAKNASLFTRHKLHVWLRVHLLETAEELTEPLAEHLPGNVVRENVTMGWLADGIAAYKQLRESLVAWGRTPTVIQKMMAQVAAELEEAAKVQTTPA